MLRLRAVSLRRCRALTIPRCSGSPCWKQRHYAAQIMISPQHPSLLLTHIARQPQRIFQSSLTKPSSSSTAGLSEFVQTLHMEPLVNELMTILQDVSSSRWALRTKFQKHVQQKHNDYHHNTLDETHHESNAAIDNKLLSAVTLLRTATRQDWMAFDALPLEGDEDPVQVEASESLNPKGDNEHVEELMDMDTIVDDTFEVLRDLLQISMAVDESVSVTTWHAFLLWIALSPNLLPNQILELLMRAYEAMKASGVLDDDDEDDDTAEHTKPLTYEILFLALSRRLGTRGSAMDILHDMMHHNAFTPYSLDESIQLCAIRSNANLACEIVDQVAAMPQRRFQIPVSTFDTLIGMLQHDGNVEQAQEILLLCLKELDNRTRDEPLDQIFVNAIHWPKRRQSYDNTSALKMISDVLVGQTVYAPAFRVWRCLIVGAARGAKRNPSRWNIVAQAFSELAKDIPDFFPDEELLAVGLDASVGLADPTLAADLMVRFVNNRHVFPNHRPLPIRLLQYAISITAELNDSVALQSVLEGIDVLATDLPAAAFQSLMNQGVQELARLGNPEIAEGLTLELAARGHTSSDAAMGAVIQGYAEAGKTDKALELAGKLVNSMDIGPSIFHSVIFCHVRLHNWEAVWDLYVGTKDFDVRPQPAAYHGLLLAASKTGGTPRILELLNEAVQSSAVLSHEALILAFQLLLPELDTCNDLKAISETIRELAHTCSSHKNVLLQLLRSVQSAMSDDERRPSGIVTEEDVKRRQHEAWRHVIQCLLECHTVAIATIKS